MTGRKYLAEYSDGEVSSFILGDPVVEKGTSLNAESLIGLVRTNRLNTLGGFFYLLQVVNSKELVIFSSVFNILPLYYAEWNGCILISSRTHLIREYCGDAFPVDKQYLLEQVLFNYGLFKRTYWSGIYLSPANHVIKLNTRLEFTKTFDIEDFFSNSPARGHKALSEIADEFLDITAKYFPDYPYALSFTGGFDGRTLTAASIYHKKSFSGFSFGSQNASDLLLPMEQAEKFGINFLPIHLEDEYISSFYSDGLDLIRLSEGQASFNRAQYVYAARILSVKFSHMITGNFGSELFRAAHVAGAITTGELFEVIRCSDKKQISSIILRSPKIRYLKKNQFKAEIESLIHELTAFRESNHGLNRNALLYKYTFTETARKYFGPEIVMQSNFLFNRTPYLDFSFFKYLLSTFYCGAYSGYKTDNPLKRFKGQLPYAYIIRKASPLLFCMPTNKGYRPCDLMSFYGKLRLLANLMRNKGNKAHDNDPYSLKRAFTGNLNKYLEWNINEDLYNQSDVKAAMMSGARAEDRGIMFKILSANYYLQCAKAWE